MRSSTMLLAMAAALLLHAVAAAGCVTCYFDYDRCLARVSSEGIGCQSACECGLAPETSYLDSLHPGFFTTQRFAMLVVTGVIPGSPADRVGIRPGDEVISINHHSPVQVYACLGSGWASPATPTQTLLTLQRDGHRITVAIGLEQVRDILDRNWASRKDTLAVSQQFSRRNYAPYTFGLDVGIRNGQYVVSDVLAASPAERQGLRTGDRLVTVNQFPLSEQEASMLLSPGHGVVVVLTIERNAKLIKMTLRSESILSAYHALVERETPPRDGRVLAALK